MVLTTLVKPDRVNEVVPLMLIWPFALLVSEHQAPSLFASRKYVLFIVFVTYIPLMNTWPVRVVRDAALHVDMHGWTAFLQPGFIALCALVVLFPPKLRRKNAFFIAAMCLWTLGGIISLGRTPYLGLGVEQLVTAVFMPILTYLIFVNVPLAENEWRAVLSGFFVSALCPVVLGLMAYIKTFGVPVTAASFMQNKLEMYLPGAMQTYTYGNVGHLAEYLLLTIIPALGLLVHRRQEPKAKWVAWPIFAAYILSATVLAILIQVRGLVITLLIGLILAGVYELTQKRFLRAVPAFLVFAGIAASSLLLYGSFYRSLIPMPTTAHFAALATPPSVSVAAATVQAKPAKADPKPVSAREAAPAPANLADPSLKPTASKIDASRVGNPTVPESSRSSAGMGFKVNDPSAELRWDAIKQGIQILKRAWPLGIGIGAYATYDPRLTAAHSFAVQEIAETGIFGALFLIVLLTYIAVRFVLSWSRRSGGHWFALTCSAFLAYLCVFGGVFAIIGIAVWGVVFALWVALLERGLFPGETT